MNVGSPFPPAEHDRSFKAVDKIRPRTTVIAEGGTVTFNVGPVHQIAIYEAGTEPEDISLAPANLDPNPLFPGPPVINDPDGRLALGDPLSFPGYQLDYTFTEPGRYLVICTFLPHFTEAKMYAYIEVKAVE
jgi:plastocyanin